MNKYKIVCIVLAVGLLAALARIVAGSGEPATDTRGNAALRNILSRKSVRSYTDRDVTAEQIDTLLRAAMAAPTGRDVRPWRFVVVDRRSVLDSLHDRLPKAAMLAEAKAAIVVCADSTAKAADGQPTRNWALDCAAATENLLLAAEAMGLGAVWTGVYPYEERMAAVKAVLHLPDSIVPLNVVPIGYPKGKTQPKDKYNPGQIHYNRW